MFFIHFLVATLQFLMFTLIAGFMLGFLGQEFKLDRAAQAEAKDSSLV